MLCAGCVVTPLPDPPTIDPPDVERMFVNPTSTGPLDIDAMAGTVDPGLTVVAVNLDGIDPPVRALADVDGGFSMTVRGSLGDVVRVHAEMDGVRSVPVDFVATGGMPSPLAPALGCLTMPDAIAFGDVAVGSSEPIAIPIDNGCSAQVQVDAIALRVPTAGLNVRTATPLTIAPSASATIEVDAAPTAAGALEEVLLIGIAAPEVGRRAVTLHGTAR
jgi:ASPM-SPD-2-Hydin domain-containing protein